MIESAFVDLDRSSFRDVHKIDQGENDVELGASPDMTEVLLELRADVSPPSDEMRAGVESRLVTPSEEGARWFG